MQRIAWIDVESDGLYRPGQPMPTLLEVACVVTTGDLHELGRYEAVIRHPVETRRALDPCQLVLDMHHVNGLWAALEDVENTVPVERAEDELLSLLASTCGEDPVVWGGNSPSALDRPLLASLMPRLYGRLHYRTLDLTSLKMAHDTWTRPAAEDEESNSSHRAMADVLDMIETAALHRQAALPRVGAALDA